MLIIGLHVYISSLYRPGDVLIQLVQHFGRIALSISVPHPLIDQLAASVLDFAILLHECQVLRFVMLHSLKQ